MREAAREKSKAWRTLAWSLDYEKDRKRRYHLKMAALRAERIVLGKHPFQDDAIEWLRKYLAGFIPGKQPP